MSEEKERPLDLRTRILIWLGAQLLRGLALTWRMRTVEGERLTNSRAKHEPVLFTLWHGQMLPVLWQHRNQSIAIVISEHRDGEIIARVAAILGNRSIRGSTSRGGGRALIALARELTEGRDAAITPDGPRGPSHSFAPGALVAAQRSGKGLLLVGVHADRAWHLGSWDGFMIPKPFTRVTLAYCGPVYVTAATPREAAEQAAEYQRMMEETVAQAARG